MFWVVLLRRKKSDNKARETARLVSGKSHIVYVSHHHQLSQHFDRVHIATAYYYMLQPHMRLLWPYTYSIMSLAWGWFNIVCVCVCVVILKIVGAVYCITKQMHKDDERVVGVTNANHYVSSLLLLLADYYLCVNTIRRHHYHNEFSIVQQQQRQQLLAAAGYLHPFVLAPLLQVLL